MLFFCGVHEFSVFIGHERKLLLMGEGRNVKGSCADRLTSPAVFWKVDVEIWRVIVASPGFRVLGGDICLDIRLDQQSHYYLLHSSTLLYPDPHVVSRAPQ